jgi:hypothetical protein
MNSPSLKQTLEVELCTIRTSGTVKRSVASPRTFSLPRRMQSIKVRHLGAFVPCMYSTAHPPHAVELAPLCSSCAQRRGRYFLRCRITAPRTVWCWEGHDGRVQADGSGAAAIASRSTVQVVRASPEKSPAPLSGGASQTSRYLR